MVEAFRDGGVPEDIFQFLHLTHHATEAIIRDSRVNYVAFAGSVPGGEMVEKTAMGRFIGIGLELGGKDPAYVRRDSDYYDIHGRMIYSYPPRTSTHHAGFFHPGTVGAA